MRQREMHKAAVDTAATVIARHMRQSNGGRLPRSCTRWQRLLEAHDVYAGPIPFCPEHFTARLWYDEAVGEWLVTYNPAANARQVSRWLAHELAEYLAIQDYPSLFDDLPQQVYHYTGGSDPTDARHRIARRVEAICFRRTV